MQLVCGWYTLHVLEVSAGGALGAGTQLVNRCCVSHGAVIWLQKQASFPLTPHSPDEPVISGYIFNALRIVFVQALMAKGAARD